MKNFTNYYDVLGVDKNATRNQILLRGENLIHYIENDEAFEMEEEEKRLNISRIKKAMAILSDETLRAIHDDYLEKQENTTEQVVVDNNSYEQTNNDENLKEKLDSLKNENGRKFEELSEQIDRKFDELEESLYEDEEDNSYEEEVVEENDDDIFDEEEVVEENNDAVVEESKDNTFKETDEYGNTKWSPKDILILTRTYNYCTAKNIAIMLDKDVHDVEMMAAQLELTNNSKKNNKPVEVKKNNKPVKVKKNKIPVRVKKNNKPVRVVRVVKDTKNRKAVKEELKRTTREVIIAAIILGIGIATCASIIYFNNKSKNKGNVEVEKPTKTYTTDVNNETKKGVKFEEVSKEVEETPEVIYNTPEEETKETEVIEEVKDNSNDYTQTVVAEEPVQEQQTSSREQIVENIKNNINNLQNKNLVTDIDIDVINALVDYANGEKVIPNTYAYDKFQELTKAGFDISEFFKNTDSYNNVNALATKLASIVEDKGNYDDEYKAYQQIHASVNNLKNDFFPEAVAISAMVDYKINLNSMVIARGGANDGVSVAEAGKDYKNEIDAAASHANECLEIFNEVNIYDANSILTQIICRAAEEDENRSLSRN